MISGCKAFSTPSTQVPVFLQNFPNLVFDPFTGMLSNNNTGVGSTTRPFTDIVLNASGASAGTIVAQGNSAQAGVGSLAGFSAVLRGSFVVTQAGNYTLNVGAADGFIFGVGNGPAKVSGIDVNPPASNVTVFSHYPIVGVNNGPTTDPLGHTTSYAYDGTGNRTSVTYPYPADRQEADKKCVTVRRGLNGNNPGALRFDAYGLSTFEVLFKQYP